MIVEATTEVRPVSSSTGELVILERLFGESFIKLGELHRYTFELVDAFVNNAAERYRIIATEGLQGCRLSCSNSRHSASSFKSRQQSLCARRGRTTAWLHGAPADPCPSAGRKEKSKRTPAMTMDRATSRE